MKFSLVELEESDGKNILTSHPQAGERALWSTLPSGLILMLNNNMVKALAR